MKSREINKKRAMGPASFDEILEKITAPTLTTENWDGILTFCDHINSYSEGAKLGLKSLRKRLNHRDPHVILMAISVLDSCWANCGERFRKEVSSAQFINELKALSTNSQRLVSEKTRVTLQKWVENECKTDQSLSLIVSLVKTLKEDGYSFVVEDPKKKSQTAAMAKYSNDPNFVSSAQEEEEIAKAIAASLADAEKQDKLKKNTTSLYPATNKSSSASNLITERKVRALYDFEAAESNELSFVSGDIITITDESNPHWWTGKIGNQIGLFPSSFVTNDIEDSKLKNAATSEKTPEVVASINEATLVQCLNVLHECDPTGERADPPELAQLEAASYAQRPLIDAHLASIDHQSNSLAQIDIAIRDVLALYDDAIQKGGYPQSQSIYAPHIAPSPHHQQQQYAYPPQPNPYQQYQNGQAQPIPQQQQQQPFFSQYGGQQPIQQQQQQQYYSQSNPQQSQPPPPPPPQQQQWTAPQTQQF